jgi:hypothetical protein
MPADVRWRIEWTMIALTVAAGVIATIAFWALRP